jgi:hypothetical protein
MGTMDAITRHRLGFLGLEAAALEEEDLLARLDLVHRAFIEHLPYENLSDHESCRRTPEEPDRWPRTTDVVLRDHRTRGLGGACFSLAYALRDLLHGVGANAHFVVGRNLVTERCHAAVLVLTDGRVLLFDASLLAARGFEAIAGAACDDVLGTVRLEAADETSLTVVLERRGTARAHAVYTFVPAPVPPSRFRQAWIGDFDRGRRGPLVLARRRKDVLVRYREKTGLLETLTPEGFETRRLGPAPVTELHEAFGVDRGCLEAFFVDGAPPTP